MDIKEFIKEQKAKGITDGAKIYDAFLKQQTETKDTIQRGFIGEIIPTSGAILGGIGGGALTRTPQGAIAGSALGGAGGEAIQQGIEKITGERKDFNTGQIAATGVTSGLLEGGTRAATAGIKLGYKALGGTEGMFNVMGKLSGYTPEIIGKAFERGTGVIKGVLEGEHGLNQVVINTIKGVQELASKTLAESQKMIAKLSVGTKSIFPEPIESKFVNEYVSAIKGIFKDHNIKVTPIKKMLEFGVSKGRTLENLIGNDLLEFAGKTPSRIISGSEKAAIQEAYDTAKNILKNKTVKGFDAALERLIALRSKTPAGTPTGGETKVIIGKIIDTVKDQIKNNIVTKAPGRTAYADFIEFLDNMLPKRVMIEDAKDIFGSTAHPSAQDVSKITTRMLQMYNAGRTAVREGAGSRVGIEQIGEKVGQDITGTAAGALMKAGEQFSVRAPQLTKRAMMTKVIEYLPRKAILDYVKTGQMTGELLNNNFIKVISATTGLSAKAILQEAVSLLENKSINQ